ncbi:MAG TPA: NADH-quinone oxidoreductase subunit M [Verrucomicrobiae bacterium]|jgi:NADH-quinone oxidoreductase subunit M|nr:NADH-quinone oxidoreductase subunit M [Verrucomicrobiae bacterium]
MSPLTWIFIFPLLAAVGIVLIPRNYRFVIRCVALAATAISMLLSISMFASFMPGVPGFQFEQQRAWAGDLGISYHVGVDGLNIGLILMGATVAFAAVCVSSSIKTREKEFYILLLTMAGGILGAFASLDLFCFYFLHELALVPTFIMIGVWGKGERKNYATYQITLYLSLGALLALLGLIAVYLQLPAGHRTFDIPQIIEFYRTHRMAESAQRIIFPMLLFGFGILVSLWPFHTWAPLGYGSAPTGTAMIHAGVLKKFGLYGLIRLALPIMPDEAQRWAVTIMALSLGNIIYCGFVAMRQRNLNMLIGNSSVAHMGFAFLGIASLSLVGITGAAVVMVAHGFLAALTFALSGYLHEQTGTLEIDRMGGLLRRLPFIGAVTIMAMMAGCGLPGFAGFPGEVLSLFGSWGRSQVMTGVAVWGALVIGGVYMTRAIRNILHGEKEWPNILDATSLWRRLPFGLLLAGLLLFGCFPRLLTDGIKVSVEPIVGMAAGELHAVKGGHR